MITKIEIDGFKSFVKFQMNFTPLTIVAGTNASGKSNLFDAIKLLSDLADSDLRTAFKNQRGEMNELFYLADDNTLNNEMHFAIEMLVDKEVGDAWGNKQTLKYTRLRYELKIQRYLNASGLDDLQVLEEKLEALKHKDDEWVKLQISPEYIPNWRPKVPSGRRTIPYIQTSLISGVQTVEVPQDGTTGNKRRFPLTFAKKTVLSSFDTVDFPHILAAKEEMRNWRFLELSPEALRRPTSKKTGEDSISPSGENLAGALHRIIQIDSLLGNSISKRVNDFLPEFVHVSLHDDPENQHFLVKLEGVDGTSYSSRVLSEGTLRILALCILQNDEEFKGLLCFEEPENGLHPMRIKLMFHLLQDLTVHFDDQNSPLRQVVINTHSPFLLAAAITSSGRKKVSVHYSRMNTLITDRLNSMTGESVRVKLKVTNITEVDMEPQLKLPLPNESPAKKIALNQLIEILGGGELNAAADKLKKP